MTVKMHFHRLFSVFLMLIHLYVPRVSAISAILSPSSDIVFVNGEVEFQCKIVDDENYKLVWIIDYDPNDPDNLWLVIEAESSSPIDHPDDGHGVLNIEYSNERFASLVVHDLKLTIKSIKVADGGSYACGYVTGVIPYRVSPVSSWASLTILVPPHEQNPRCSAPKSISLSSAIDTETVELTCEISGGSPRPDLTWYRGTSPDSFSSTTTTINTVHYTVGANDNGVQFTCVATGSALQKDGFCSVTPLLVIPSVSISYSANPVIENSDVTFTCVGSGLPSISKIEWMYNNQLLSESNLEPDLFLIVDVSDHSSELHLISIQLNRDGDLVTCHVETPSGLSNRESISISVVRSVVPTDSYMTASDGVYMSTDIIKTPVAVAGSSTSLAVPISAAVAGVILLLVIAIVSILIWKRRKSITDRDNSQRPIIRDGHEITRDNVYQMSDVLAADAARPASSEQPLESGYVINQIPDMNLSTGQQTGTETIGSSTSDHRYDTVNFGTGQTETRTPDTNSAAGHQIRAETIDRYDTVNFGTEQSETRTPIMNSRTERQTRTDTIGSDHRYDTVNYGEGQTDTRTPDGTTGQQIRTETIDRYDTVNFGAGQIATIGSDHAYATVNRSDVGEPKPQAPTNAAANTGHSGTIPPYATVTRPSTRETISPYATNRVGNEEGISYAELELSNDDSNPNARQRPQRTSEETRYAVIEGEL